MRVPETPGRLCKPADGAGWRHTLWMVLPGMFFSVPVPEYIGIVFTIVMLVTTCLPWCYKNVEVAAILHICLFAGSWILSEYPIFRVISTDEPAMDPRDWLSRSRTKISIVSNSADK
jgi:hypothetical protein